MWLKTYRAHFSSLKNAKYKAWQTLKKQPLTEELRFWYTVLWNFFTLRATLCRARMPMPLPQRYELDQAAPQCGSWPTLLWKYRHQPSWRKTISHCLLMTFILAIRSSCVSSVFFPFGFGICPVFMKYVFRARETGTGNTPCSYFL